MNNILTEGLNKIEFSSCGLKLIGNLYCPPQFDSNVKYSTIVAAGPMGTVKEQAAGVFAEKLANKGHIALTFDFRTQGESEGSPKNYENPFNKAEDIQNAISYLVPVHKWPFYPNSSLLSKFNPRNITYMPVVKFIERLDFEQNISFMDRHYLGTLDCVDKERIGALGICAGGFLCSSRICQ